MKYKTPVTTIRQIVADFDRNILANQIKLFVKNGGTIKQLPSYKDKQLNINPCGWQKEAL